MLATIPNPHMSPANAILLDFTSAVIALFLDFYDTRVDLVDPEHDFYLIREYRKLIHHLDFNRLTPVADAAYGAVSKLWPFEVLMMASEANNLVLASNALLWCAHGRHRTALNSTTVFTLAEQLRFDWRVAFLRSLMVKCSYREKELETGWPGKQQVEQFVSDVEAVRAAFPPPSNTTKPPAKKQKRS